MDGFYYLHMNGALIFKRDYDGVCADLRESDFVRAFWGIDITDRANAWRILVEGLAGGAQRSRIFELASKWGCNDHDALNYADHVECALGQDGDAKTATRKDCRNIQESPIGFGDTYLEAMADLCRQLGYVPAKTWPASFELLCKTTN